MKELIKAEPIELKTVDGFTLSGTLQQVQNPRAFALFMHGLTSTQDEKALYPDLADAFARQGVASLRFDFRGHGQSQGSSLDFSILAALEDI